MYKKHLLKLATNTMRSEYLPNKMEIYIVDRITPSLRKI